ncbi:alpha/beta hydrolase [Lentisphaera profundi]|uniref:Alpha/beta hydrolase n=1 Tax=Lentisphaera profundi TaxID=1658616 RepID=A0ABY7VV72_9BACT|nr:alpha/beta hydrolase [Lentisphaera profundi]WDE97612.1 alpha/beta hydrolase [Lentisphaera profundi]
MNSLFKKISSSLFISCLIALTCASGLHAAERQELRLWPEFAPGETNDKNGPRLYLYQPEKKTSDSIMLIFPGGGYHGLAIDHEGWKIAEYFNKQGVTAAVLKYRVPRRKGMPKHMAAWQDAQRAVRIIRSNATKWNINPEKIAALGFSAGGHLTLMTSTTSQTPAYKAIDELDKLPCHVNFAVPVYPAYVLEDGSNGPNKGKGNDSTIVKDFKFDSKTPPMCLIHGDTDQYSAMGSVAIYHKLRTKQIPAELHIFAKVGHGFGANPTLRPNNKHIGDWLNRSYEALKVFGF